MLPKDRRVKKRENFSEIFSERKFINGDGFRIYYKLYDNSIKSNSQSPNEKIMFPRFAVVTSKKIGNAVTRNKYRRRIFEIIRNHEIYDQEISADIVVVTYPGILKLSKNELSEVIEKSLNITMRNIT